MKTGALLYLTLSGITVHSFDGSSGFDTPPAVLLTAGKRIQGREVRLTQCAHSSRQKSGTSYPAFLLCTIRATTPRKPRSIPTRSLRGVFAIMTTSVYHTAYARHVKNVGFAFVIPVAYRNPQCLRASGVSFLVRLSYRHSPKVLVDVRAKKRIYHRVPAHCEGPFLTPMNRREESHMETYHPVLPLEDKEG